MLTQQTKDWGKHQAFIPVSSVPCPMHWACAVSLENLKNSLSLCCEPPVNTEARKRALKSMRKTKQCGQLSCQIPKEEGRGRSLFQAELPTWVLSSTVWLQRC